MTGAEPYRQYRQFRLPLDWPVLQAVHDAELHHSPLHDVARVLDLLGVAFAGALVAAAAWLAWRRPRLRACALAGIAGALGAYAVTAALKPIVDRAPPYLAGRLAAGQLPDPVFPEGPGALAVGFAVALAGRSRWLAAAALAYAAEDAFVQVGRGSHWPSDLYAAWLLGLAGGLAARAAAAAVSRRARAFPDS